MRRDPPLPPLAALRWSVVRSILDEMQPRRVLELGCGQGAFGARIAARSEYVGVEPDQQSYQLARSRIEPRSGRVLHGSSELIDSGEQFDLVCAFEVVEHLADDRGAVADWVRRTAPGGAVMVSVPAWPGRYGPWDELVGHYRRYTPDQLDTLLTEAGCRQVRHVLYGWPLGFATETVRNQIAARRNRGRGTSMSVRTGASGRTLQPNRFAGRLVQAGTAPFAVLQRQRANAGTGLIGIGRHTPLD